MSEFTLDIHDIRVSGSKIVPGPVLKLADVSTPLSPLPGTDCSPPHLSEPGQCGASHQPSSTLRRGEKSCYGGGMPIKIPVDFDIRDDYKHQRRREELLQFCINICLMVKPQAYFNIMTIKIWSLLLRLRSHYHHYHKSIVRLSVSLISDQVFALMALLSSSSCTMVGFLISSASTNSSQSS